MNTPQGRWDDVKELFGDALDAAPADRERLLSDREGADSAMVREVRSLLAAHEQAGERFARPAALVLSDGAAGESALDQVPSLEGHRLGAYEVGRKIGEGGMGAVYEAVRADDEYRHRVAVKTISRGAGSGAIVRRFRRERQILAGLQHPNVAALFDGGVTESGTPYLVMEYVDGLPIDAWCTTHRLTLPQRLDLFRQACAAVQHAHRRLIVHRDIKPHNVMVSSNGTVKLLDFGIAKLLDTEGSDAGPADTSLTDTGLTPLTTAYASPEQARGEPVSTATDIYSLGVVLYQLLSGVPPFAITGKTRAQVLSQITDETPVAPSVACTSEAATACGLGTRQRLVRAITGELDAIVMMAMRKEPERRYASVDALSDDIHRYLRGLPVSARPDTVGYRMRKFVVRRRGLVVAGLLAVLATIAGTGVTLWQSRQASLEAERTNRIADFLQSLLGAADVTTLGGSLPRVGPRASVSALLDSAARRVPQQFATDPLVRARLYTTIGAGLITQSRVREASVVLDSAVRLTKAAYGAKSQAFALANIEAGEAAFSRNLLDDAKRFDLAAKLALEGASLTGTELYSRAIYELATVAQIEGDYRALDSLANRALTLENRRTSRPTMVKAGALNRLGVEAVVRWDLPRADSLEMLALSMIDSLHAEFSLDRIDVLGNLVSISGGEGRMARADSLTQQGLSEAERVFGPDSREFAYFLSYQSTLNLRHGDSALSRVRVERAMRIIDSIPEVTSPMRYVVHSAYAVYLSVLGRLSGADSVRKVMLDEVGQRQIGVQPMEAHLLYGITRALLHDLPGAEEHLRQAQAIYSRSWVRMPAWEQSIHAHLASVYAREGKDAAAEEQYALLPAVHAGALKDSIPRLRAADLDAARKAKPAPKRSEGRNPAGV